MKREDYKCGKCTHFNGRTKRPRTGFRVVYGECRRFPPMVTNVWEPEERKRLVPAGSLYPEVHSDKWCSEFKPKESEEHNEQ